MIDRAHDLPITRQAEVLNISRGSVYYLPRPVPEADLAIMRRLDRLHLEFPFAGSRMLRGLLAGEGCRIGRRHVKTLMKRMGRRRILFDIASMRTAVHRAEALSGQGQRCSGPTAGMLGRVGMTVAFWCEFLNKDGSRSSVQLAMTAEQAETLSTTFAKAAAHGRKGAIVGNSLNVSAWQTRQPQTTARRMKPFLRALRSKAPRRQTTLPWAAVAGRRRTGR